MFKQPHQLDANVIRKLHDGKDNYSDNAVALARGLGSNKTLILRTNMNTLKAKWIVMNDRNVVLTTASLDKAVAKYNSLP